MANTNLQFYPNIQPYPGLIQPLLAETTSSFYNPQFEVQTSATAVQMPTNASATAQAFLVYLNNLGSTNITVSWTPSGGSSAVVGVLVPDAVLILWVPYTSSPPSAGGITALSLTSSGTTGQVAVLVAQ